MKTLSCFLLMTLLCATSAFGQRTISPASQAFAQQAQALREIQYSLQELSAKVEALEQQQFTLASRLAALERGGNAATKDDLAALRADFDALKNEQGKMRGEIVSDLSNKIKTIAEKQRAAAAAAAEQQRAAQKSGYTHVVEAGQTISAIAQAYKVPAASIMKANKIKDATKIRVGQELFIPDP
ncbi:MAG: LysM peptidoglycan-binding domain-containing protein [Kiritimatiellae bacterium]|nr:LysM peptidoglycan-binding domain-containing protein [Kiritimatiellia bacterium]